MAGGVFISYRRSDSAAFSGRIADYFGYHQKDTHVFFDINGIEPGEDFAEKLRTQIESSEVVLAMIGETWLGACDTAGNRRLDDPGDFVRLELSTSLAMGARVIPVLLDRAQMPSAGDLPDDLKALANCNAQFVRAEAFQRDAEHLANFVADFLARSEKTVAPSSDQTPRKAGNPIYDHVVQSFEAFERNYSDGFIIFSNEADQFIQFANPGDGYVVLDLPRVALKTPDQRAAADRFFSESTNVSGASLDDDDDTYNLELPLDAPYLARIVLDVFEYIYENLANAPLTVEMGR
tara:strand:+ start:3708 stop:4586 length:879 start_codon:yes stop_codon:yes gene_type:complete